MPEKNDLLNALKNALKNALITLEGIMEDLDYTEGRIPQGVLDEIREAIANAEEPIKRS